MKTYHQYLYGLEFQSSKNVPKTKKGQVLYFSRYLLIGERTQILSLKTQKT